jgi:hypothetical protein
MAERLNVLLTLADRLAVVCRVERGRPGSYQANGKHEGPVGTLLEELVYLGTTRSKSNWLILRAPVRPPG